MNHRHVDQTLFVNQTAKSHSAYVKLDLLGLLHTVVQSVFLIANAASIRRASTISATIPVLEHAVLTLNVELSVIHHNALANLAMKEMHSICATLNEVFIIFFCVITKRLEMKFKRGEYMWVKSHSQKTS